MASLQTSMKELRTLKQEESTLMNLASKISDQLNRLKVEELALQNMVRLQNEELESKQPRKYSQQQVENDNVNNRLSENLEKGDKSTRNNDSESVVPLNLVVNKYHQHDGMMEEEEEDDEEMESEFAEGHDDIEQFVNSL